MKKPNGYDECKVGGRETPEVGGHKAIILNMEELGFKVGKPKTQTSARVVPIDDELLECLRPYKDVGYLFANRWGAPYELQ